jgi:elongation factor Ts
MQCKKALEEAGGDVEKAKIILYKISKQSADKKADRSLGAGAVVSYIHNNGTVGVLLELMSETDFVARNEAFRALARDIAMHAAAMAPEYVKMEDVKEEDKTKAKELFEKDALDKPVDIRAKIIEGKLGAYFNEKVLLEQSFIKNPEVTVKSLIEQAVQKFGERIEVGRLARFSIN